MPQLQIPSDHCLTAADVRAQCSHAIRMRRRMMANHSARHVRVDGGWVRVDRIREVTVRRPAPGPDYWHGFYDQNDKQVASLIGAIRMYFGCDDEDIFMGPAGTSSDSRQVAMYLLQKLYGHSSTKVAVQFGINNSSSVWALKKIENLLVMDPHHPLCLAVMRIRVQLGQAS